jgi:hypothetical protein
VRAHSHADLIGEVAGEHGAAGEQRIQFVERQHEDIVSPVQPSFRAEVIADREGDTAKTAVEERLLETGALPQLNRPLGPGEQHAQDERARPADHPKHALRFGHALGLLPRQQDLGRLAVAQRVGSEDRDERGRVLLVTRSGQHQLRRAAEAPVVEIRVEGAGERRKDRRGADVRHDPLGIAVANSAARSGSARIIRDSFHSSIAGMLLTRPAAPSAMCCAARPGLPRAEPAEKGSARRSRPSIPRRRATRSSSDGGGSP